MKDLNEKALDNKNKKSFLFCIVLAYSYLCTRLRGKKMKKKSLIPQYLQDELSNLVQKKDAYTEDDIDQLSRDYDYVLKQREQLKEAEKYGAIPKEEAAITNLTLMVKQFIIQETTKDAMRYLEQEKERLDNRIKELEQGN